VPGAPDGVTVDIDNDPPVNSSGRTAFLTDLQGDGVDNSNDDAIWSDASGSPALIARSGDHPPGTPTDMSFRGFGRPAINSVGQVAFQAYLDRDPNDFSPDQSIWLADSTSLSLIARTGDTTPGTSNGVKFDWVGWDHAGAALNSAGQVAFSATLSGIDVDDTNDNGVWSGNVGSLRLIARAGEPAPGAPSGVNLHGLLDPVLNAAGRTAFFAWLSGSEVDESNNMSIWSEGSGSLALLAREGDQAPGTPIGTRFSSAALAAC